MSELEIFSFIGKFIAWVASGAAGAFIFFKFIGQRWIENKFAKDLELFKTQKLHEFDLLLSRKTKWNEAEHEVLSISWKKLKNAHNYLRRSVSGFKEYSDLDRMNEGEFRKFINRNDLSESENDYLISQKGKRNAAYDKILDYRSLNEAHKAFLDFHSYFEENRIFLRPHIKENFDKVDDYIWSAWVSKKMSLDLGDGKTDFLMEAYKKENEEIKPLIKKIEETIQRELFPEST